MVALPSLDRLSHAEQLAYIRVNRKAFVGRLLIGVMSTGIYCLPSCMAREPKPENVRFFKTEEEAQAAGLRPCRRCHPDYFYRDYDPDSESLAALVEAMRREPGAFSGVDNMVASSGIGVTKLHALFRQHYHTTPAIYLSRVRIATACAVLADPNRRVIDAAYAAGYKSLSAFHDNFRKAMGLSPKDYQQLGKTNEFTITLPEDYLPWVTLKLLGRDADSIIERVSGKQAIKALSINSKPLLLHMEWTDREVRCRVDSSVPLSTAAMQSVHCAAIRMLGFWTNPTAFERAVSANPDHARLIDGRRGMRIPLYADMFEAVTWAIVGQQVNLAFAYKLRRELAQLSGTPAGAGLVAHPTPEAVSALDYADLTSRQYSRRKAEYLIDTARLVASVQLQLDPLGAASQVEKQLLAVRGLGPWSVNYIMMRALGHANCVPFGDTGLTTALQRLYQLDHRPDVAETADLMQPFEPYRSLATYHLWLSLGANPV